MEHKTEQIKNLTNHFINKYGSENIVLTDFWDGDNTAISFFDKTKQYLIYIADYGNTENRFFVSLENPPTSKEFPYTPAGDYENLTLAEVETILIKHLKIT